jgi:hypothetical protein
MLIEEDVLTFVKDAVIKAVFGLNVTGSEGGVSEGRKTAQIQEIFAEVDGKKKDLEIKFITALFPTGRLAEARNEFFASVFLCVYDWRSTIFGTSSLYVI